MERPGKIQKRRHTGSEAAEEWTSATSFSNSHRLPPASQLQDINNNQTPSIAQQSQLNSTCAVPPSTMEFEDYLSSFMAFKDIDVGFQDLYPMPIHVMTPPDGTTSKPDTQLFGSSLNYPSAKSHQYAQPAASTPHNNIKATLHLTQGEGLAPHASDTGGSGSSQSHLTAPSAPVTPAPRGDAALQAFLPEMQRYLTKLLYNLRCRRDEQFFGTDEVDKQKQRQVLFPLVQFFCTTLRSLMTYYRDTLSLRKPADDDEESNMTFMLCFMAASLVLEMYKSIIRAQTSQPIRAEPLQSNQQPTPNESPNWVTTTSLDTVLANQAGVSRQITNSIIHLTVMDCHLASLQHVFHRLDVSKSFKTLLAGNSNGIAEIQTLRSNTQKVLDDLKTQL